MVPLSAFRSLKVEPPKQLDNSADKKGCQAVAEELRALLGFLCIPTFCIMVVNLGGW